MQIFYKYAALILSVLGAVVGLTGYYLNSVYRSNYEGLVWLVISVILTMAGFITGILIQRLNLSSHTDYLTGLWNRRYFYLRLDEEEALATRNKTPLCVAMIDVDNFKEVNDTYGHDAGDLLLSDLAAIFKRNVRETDIVTRWGGDEFAIIFSETALEDALEVMERIRHKVEAKFHSSYSLTISAGVISLEPDQDSEDLFIKTDQALYKAKKQRNSITTIAMMNEITK